MLISTTIMLQWHVRLEPLSRPASSPHCFAASPLPSFQSLTNAPFRNSQRLILLQMPRGYTPKTEIQAKPLKQSPLAVLRPNLWICSNPFRINTMCRHAMQNQCNQSDRQKTGSRGYKFRASRPTDRPDSRTRTLGSACTKGRLAENSGSRASFVGQL
jgi:hypothetical protein